MEWHLLIHRFRLSLMLEFRVCRLENEEQGSIEAWDFGHLGKVGLVHLSCDNSFGVPTKVTGNCTPTPSSERVRTCFRYTQHKCLRSLNKLCWYLYYQEAG